MSDRRQPAGETPVSPGVEGGPSLPTVPSLAGAGSSVAIAEAASPVAIGVAVPSPPVPPHPEALPHGAVEPGTPAPPSFAAPSFMPAGTLTRESKALELLAIGATLAILWVALPLGTGILLGALMAFTLQPVHARLVARTGRPVLSSLATVTGASLLIVGAVGGFGSLFVSRGVALTRALLVQVGPGGALRHQAEAHIARLQRLGISAEQVTEKLQEGAAEIAKESAALAEAAASATASGLLGLFFALFTMQYILVHWESSSTRLAEVSPLRPQYTRALMEELQRVGRDTLLGTVVTGLAQGAFATVGFWLTGAPEPVFFGIATAVASLVPGIGTMLVWLPIALYQMGVGQVGQGVLGLAWGMVFTIGVSDYVIRPRLVGDEAVPALVTFIALFGGAEAMGLKGLVVGPVLMSLALAVLRIYAREAATRRAMAG